MRVNLLRWDIAGGLLLTSAVSFMTLPGSGLAADTSPYLLQEHGEVRVIRGLSREKNFEPAKVSPEEEQVEEVTAVSPQAQPKEASRGTTRGRGIITHRAGGHGQALDTLRNGAIHGNSIRTHRAGVPSGANIRVHRAGVPSGANIRTHRAGGSKQSKIRTHRAGGSKQSKIRMHRAGYSL